MLGAIKFEALIRSYPDHTMPDRPQHDTSPHLVNEGDPISGLQWFGRHAANLRGPSPLPMRILATVTLSFLFSFVSDAQGFETWVPYGGQRAADLFFEQELRYPSAALEAGIGGEVILALNITNEGTVSAMRVLRPVSPECDAEALRLAGFIRWSVAPGVEERRAEERHFKVPFDPKRYKRWLKQRLVLVDPVFERPVDTALTILTMRQVTDPAKPLIKGGIKGLPNHLASELRYPAEAYRYSLEGEVVVEFVVETSGSLSNMRALQDVGGGCTDEALRLLHRTPWAPAILDGKRVRSTMQVSIQFKLPKETR
mgnify:CR=1 FL=1|jgi:protein TonB